MKKLITPLLALALAASATAQDFNEIRDDGTMVTAEDRRTIMNRDTTSTHKQIPMGLKVWTVDARFGDRLAAIPDTVPHMFMNTPFTTGLRGEYNTTGNQGAPRLNRIFIDRQAPDQFVFTQPYDYFVVAPDQFHFTNTLSPITNLNYNTCGDRNNGEDHLKARFAVNAGKRLGAGFKFDYLYGRGYFANQSTAHFNYSIYASYLGDRYQAHFLASLNHQKVTENGGITNDDYISHPELFTQNYSTEEIPTVLERTWNRNDNQTLFLTHRYSLGFSRELPMTEEEIKAKRFALASEKAKKEKEKREKLKKEARKRGVDVSELERESATTYEGRPDGARIVGSEPTDSIAADTTRIRIEGEEAMAQMVAQEKKEKEDTAWVKKEFVPVTSIIHTARFDNYKRLFQAYQTPAGYYRSTFLYNQVLAGDSIYDRIRHYRLRNTVALALLEGFNKWAKAGVKVFATHDLRHFELPDTAQSQFKSFNEHTVSIGGQLVKTEGSLLHYNVTAEAWVVGEDAGQLHIDGAADLNFKILGDTVQLAAKAFIHQNHPVFFFRKYHSKHLWWDNDNLEKERHARLEGLFTFKKTNTRLRVAFDDIKNYTYFGQSYDIDDVSYQRTNMRVGARQCTDNLTLITAQIEQDFRLGILNWQSVVTYQQTSNKDVLPVPALNLYSNLFLHFKVANVLDIDLGGDVRFFTKYYAHDYSPALGQFTVQENGDNRVELGNYPIVNVYANFNLKHTRFFIMMSHVNAGKGNRFFVPHYPLNANILRFGVSWNFFN